MLVCWFEHCLLQVKMAIKASALVIALLFGVAASARVLAPAPAPVPSPSASAPLAAALPSWMPGVQVSFTNQSTVLRISDYIDHC